MSQPRLLADENIPWPLVKSLREKGLELLWIPETGLRGISDLELVNLANRNGMIILTRDRDFLRPDLRKKAKYGIIFIAEPVRKENFVQIARNVENVLKTNMDKPLLVLVTTTTIEFHRS